MEFNSFLFYILGISDICSCLGHRQPGLAGVLFISFLSFELKWINRVKTGEKERFMMKIPSFCVVPSQLATIGSYNLCSVKYFSIWNQNIFQFPGQIFSRLCWLEMMSLVGIMASSQTGLLFMEVFRWMFPCLVNISGREKNQVWHQHFRTFVDEILRNILQKEKR